MPMTGTSRIGISKTIIRYCEEHGQSQNTSYLTPHDISSLIYHLSDNAARHAAKINLH